MIISRDRSVHFANGMENRGKDMERIIRVLKNNIQSISDKKRKVWITGWVRKFFVAKISSQTLNNLGKGQLQDLYFR